MLFEIFIANVILVIAFVIIGWYLERGEGAFTALALSVVFSFWGWAIYVAIHFIAKFW